METGDQHEPEGVPRSFADRLNYLIDQYVKHSPEHARRYPKAMRDSRIREICLRAPRLDQQGLMAITNLIRNLTAAKET